MDKLSLHNMYGIMTASKTFNMHNTCAHNYSCIDTSFLQGPYQSQVMCTDTKNICANHMSISFTCPLGMQWVFNTSVYHSGLYVKLHMWLCTNT